MQVGSVIRHGRGWRGQWWEDGKRRSTRTVATKGEARLRLNAELDRIRLGAAYRPPLSFAELVERFTAQHDVQPQTLRTIEKRLKRPLSAWGSAQAGDVTGEAVSRLLLSRPWQPAYRASILATIRLVYSWGNRAHLVDVNPGKQVRQSRPDRSEKIIPFEDWAEVERVAGEAGRWGALIVFAVDCGARPGELVRLEHRHVDGARVHLPGSKSSAARRVVHLTDRGIAAYRSIPRSISTPLMFYGARGGPLSWQNWRWDTWYPALDLAGLQRRPPYSMRHTFSVWSLRAGVPLHDLSRELGHAGVEITYRTYAQWVDEMGPRAAGLRQSWAETSREGTNAAPGTPENGS